LLWTTLYLLDINCFPLQKIHTLPSSVPDDILGSISNLKCLSSILNLNFLLMLQQVANPSLACECYRIHAPNCLPWWMALNSAECVLYLIVVEVPFSSCNLSMFVKISENRKTVSFSVESLEYMWTLLKMAPAYWPSWNWQVIFLKNRYVFVQVEIEVAALLWWLLSALAKYVIHLYYVVSMELDRGHKNYAICIPKTSKWIQTWNWW
jgi:hypothetical protein